MSTIQKSTSGVRLEQCSVFARQNLYARDSRTTALPRSFSDLRFGWSFPKVRIAANGSVVYENIGKNSSLKHYKVRARFPNGYRYFGAIISGRALCNEASPRSIVFRELVQWTSRAKDILTEHENRVCFFFFCFQSNIIDFERSGESVRFTMMYEFLCGCVCLCTPYNFK